MTPQLLTSIGGVLAALTALVTAVRGLMSARAAHTRIDNLPAGPSSPGPGSSPASPR